MPDESTNLSFTAMLSHCRTTHPSIQNHHLLKFLKDNGYIIDIRTPTPFGLENGISIQTKEDSFASWPVYSQAIQDLIKENLDAIISSDTEVNFNNTQSTHQEVLKYPFLKLPNNFITVYVQTTGLDIDDEIVECCIVQNDNSVLYHHYFLPEKENVNPLKIQNDDWNNAIETASPISEKDLIEIISIIQDKTLILEDNAKLKPFFVQTLLRHKLQTKQIKKLFTPQLSLTKVFTDFIESSNHNLISIAKKTKSFRQICKNINCIRT